MMILQLDCHLSSFIWILGKQNINVKIKLLIKPSGFYLMHSNLKGLAPFAAAENS